MRASKSVYNSREFEGNSSDAQDQNAEDMIIASIRPELNYISSNPIRACIIHMLVKNKELGHTMRVEELSRRLGKRHSVIIYHLERLQDWKILRVVRAVKYGDEGAKRSIWGLNMEFPNLVREVYSHMSKTFYTQKDLDRMCSVNRNVRVQK